MPTTTRLALLALPALVTAACATPGERADTGACPIGEVCSPFTPNGLTFDGASFGDLLFDSGLHVTAAGGTQRVTIYDPSYGQVLALDFAASTDATAFAVLEQRRGGVTVEASRDGHDRLRVEDPETGELFDRVGLDAAPIARIGLHPELFGEIGVGDRPIALWTGSRVTLVVTAQDAGGVRLADESLAIVASTGDVAATWDTIAIATPGTGAVDLSATFGAGVAATFVLPVVAAVDELVPLARASTTTTVHAFEQVCFAAHAGGAHVLGAPWRFTITGPAQPVSGALAPNCAQLESTDLGTITVTATIGSVQTSQTLQVVSGKPAPAAARALAAGPTPGERAAR